MSLPYMQFYPADYFAKTRRLTCLEHGAYVQLLFMMWESNGVLIYDVDYLSGEVGLTVEEFEAVWSRISRHFQIKKGRIYNKRISEDLAEKRGISEKRKKASEMRWRGKPKENNAISDPNALQKHANSEPEPEPEPIKKERKRPSYPEDFLACWKAFPHFDGRSAQNKSYDQFKLLTDDEREGLLSAIARMASSISKEDARFVPAMERWLRDGKHRHFMDGSGQPEALDDERWRWRIEKGKASGWRTEWGEPPDNDNTKCPKHLRSAWKMG